MIDLILGQDENAVATPLELDPGERHVRVGFLQRGPGIAHFNDRDAARIQVARQLRQHAAHDLQAVDACFQTHARFVVEFVRQRVHVVLVHIRRIGDDNVVGAAVQRLEQVGVDQVHLVFDTQVLHVLLRHVQRIFTQVHAVHQRIGEIAGAGDADATTASAQVEDAADIVAVDPGFEVLLYQLGDGRTGNQYALVHLEGDAGEPAGAGEIGGGNAVHHAAVDLVGDALVFAGNQECILNPVVDVPGQVQRMQDDGDRFVPASIVAMAEGDALGVELRHGPADEIADNLQLVDGFVEVDQVVGGFDRGHHAGIVHQLENCDCTDSIQARIPGGIDPFHPDHARRIHIRRQGAYIFHLGLNTGTCQCIQQLLLQSRHGDGFAVTMDHQHWRQRNGVFPLGYAGDDVAEIGLAIQYRHPSHHHR